LIVDLVHRQTSSKVDENPSASTLLKSALGALGPVCRFGGLLDAAAPRRAKLRRGQDDALAETFSSL